MNAPTPETPPAPPTPHAPPTPPAPPPLPPVPPPATQRTSRHPITATLISLFHQYGNWLVSISWTRFFLLSILLLILTAILQRLPPFSYTIGSVAHEMPEVVVHPPMPPMPPIPPTSLPMPPTRQPAPTPAARACSA